MSCRKNNPDCTECKGTGCLFFDNNDKYQNFACFSAEPCDSINNPYGGCHTCSNYQNREEHAKELETERLQLEQRLAVIEKIRQDCLCTPVDEEKLSNLEQAFKEKEPEIGYLFHRIDFYATSPEENTMEVDSSRVGTMIRTMDIIWDYVKVLSEGRLTFTCEEHIVHPSKYYKYHYFTLKFEKNPRYKGGG